MSAEVVDVLVTFVTICIGVCLVFLVVGIIGMIID